MYKICDNFSFQTWLGITTFFMNKFTILFITSEIDKSGTIFSAHKLFRILIMTVIFRGLTWPVCERFHWKCYMAGPNFFQNNDVYISGIIVSDILILQRYARVQLQNVCLLEITIGHL